MMTRFNLPDADPTNVPDGPAIRHSLRQRWHFIDVIP